MYAVIETGGKQYRVEVGTELEVELLEAEAGQSITLDRVLLVADGAEAAVGTPLVSDAAVEAEVVGRERGDKIIVFKYRPKARRRVKKGHRQELTVLRIADIRYQGRSAAETEGKVASTKAADRKRLEEAAARQAAEDAELAARLKLGAESEEPATEQAKPAKRTRAKAAVADSAGAEAAGAAAKPARSARKSATAEAAAPDETAEAETGKDAAKPAPRRRTRAKADDAANADAATDSEQQTTSADADSPKATPRRSRTKKDG